jgi:hypothetical protein
VIFSIENIETIYKKIDYKKNSFWDQESRPLKKINFKLIDCTHTYINVAIWNEQAETFRNDFKKGDIILVDNAELSDYGGRSLSVKKSFSEFFIISLCRLILNYKNENLSMKMDQLVRMDAKNLNINNKYKKIYLVICKNN